MKIRLFTPLLLCFVMLIGSFAAADAREGRSGESVSVKVIIDGRHIQLQEPAKIINSVTYVPINPISRALGANRVDWDGHTVRVFAPGLEINAVSGDSYITANERYLYIPGKCRVLNGELTVPVRPLAKAFGAELEWNSVERSVIIRTGTNPIVNGGEFYSNEDLLWMSRIISAEARGESLAGKIAVGNVVMNRVRSPWHPDSVYGVIFDRRSGIQFTPAYSGAIYNKPSEECVIAAKLALDGAEVVGNSLYFSSSKRSSWAARNRPLTATIGNHSFYA